MTKPGLGLEPEKSYSIGRSLDSSGLFTGVLLVGGFNPFEKQMSKWESSPSMDENKKYLKPPTSL